MMTSPTTKFPGSAARQPRELGDNWTKFDRDVTLGVIGGGTVMSLLTWLATYGALTSWNKGTCDSGYLELGGFVVGLAGIPIGFFISYFFERRADAKERREGVLKFFDRIIDSVKTIETARRWFGWGSRK